MAETSSFFSRPLNRSSGCAAGAGGIAERASPTPPSSGGVSSPPIHPEDRHEESQRPLAKRRCARQKSKAAAACGICLETVVDQGFLLKRLACGTRAASCSHAYCFECVMVWAKRTNTCPMCKERFTAILHNKTGSGLLRPVGPENIVEVEHRDAAANCSSDDEDVAAALAEEDGDGDGSGVDPVDSDQEREFIRNWVEMNEHGYVLDDFLVADSDELISEEDDDEEREWEDEVQESTATRTPRRRPRSVAGGEGADEDEVVHSPVMLGSYRRRRDEGTRAIAGAPTGSAVETVSERTRLARSRRGRGGERGPGAGVLCDEVGDDRLLPNELRQLQMEAARLLGDSPLRPRRRPPPRSRLSRYPRRNRADGPLSTGLSSRSAVPPAGNRSGISSRRGTPTPSPPHDRYGRDGGDMEERRRRPGEQVRFRSNRGRRQQVQRFVGSSSASRAPSGTSSPQQRSGESDGWCATSSDEGEDDEDDEDEDEEEEEKSEIESWTPLQGRSSTASRRRRSGRGQSRGGMPTTTRLAATAAAAGGSPAPRPGTRSGGGHGSSPPRVSATVSLRNNSANRDRENRRRYGLADAVGVRRPPSTSAAVGASAERNNLSAAPSSRAAAPRPAQWLTRRNVGSRIGSSGGERQTRLRLHPPPSSGSGRSHPQQPTSETARGSVENMPLAGALAGAATRVCGTIERQAGSQINGRSTPGAAATAASTSEGGAAAAASVPAAAVRASQHDSGCTGAFISPSADEDKEKTTRKMETEERAGNRRVPGCPDSGDTTRAGDDCDSDEMADDIWMEPKSCPPGGRVQRDAVATNGRLRLRGGEGGNRWIGRREAADRPRSLRARQIREEQEEEEEEDWRVQRASSSPSDNNKEPGNGVREELEEEEEEEDEFEWDVERDVPSSKPAMSAVKAAEAAATTAAPEVHRGKERRDDDGEVDQCVHDGENAAVGRQEGFRGRKLQQQQGQRLVLERNRSIFSREPWRQNDHQESNHEDGASTRREREQAAPHSTCLQSRDEGEDGDSAEDDDKDDDDRVCRGRRASLERNGSKKRARPELDGGGGGGGQRVSWSRSRSPEGSRGASLSASGLFDQFRYTSSGASFAGRAGER